MNKAGSWMTAFTALASASALFGAWQTHRSTNLFEQSMAQSRESFLLRERIETCAELEALARKLQREANLAKHAALILQVTNNEWLVRHQRVWDAYDRFSEARKLEILGPAILRDAESNLANQAILLATSYGIAPADFKGDEVARQMEALQTSIHAFHDACVNAVGPYRQGPDGLEANFNRSSNQ